MKDQIGNRKSATARRFTFLVALSVVAFCLAAPGVASAQVRVGVGFGIPAPVAVYPAPYYAPGYVYTSPYYYGPTVVLGGGWYGGWYGGRYSRWYGTPGWGGRGYYRGGGRVWNGGRFR